MGPILDLKGKSKSSVDAFPRKDGMTPKEPEKMTCTNNHEDNAFLVEALPNEDTPFPSQDADINITKNISSNEKGLAESVSDDATECSSSFSDSDSGHANGLLSDDVEVESELCDAAATSLAFEDFGDLFRPRRKKLTPHWRKFIQPYIWHCKWAELKIRELQSQELKYRRELAVYDQRKQHDLLNSTSASTPISSENRNINIMKRKRRKRVEETTDVESYMSQHNLFNEFLVNKRKSYADNDNPYMDDDFGNSAKQAKTNFTSDELGIDGGWPCIEFKDDNSVEYILQKIDERLSEVRMLKVRMDKVIKENASKICPNVINPFNTPTASPKVLPHANGKGLSGSLSIKSQQTSHKMEDVIMPESSASSYDLLDMIGSFDLSFDGLSYDKIEDEVLIYNSNQSIKEEFDLQPFLQPTSLVEEKSVAIAPRKKAASPAETESDMKMDSKKRKLSRITHTYSRRTSGRWKRKHTSVQDSYSGGKMVMFRSAATKSLNKDVFMKQTMKLTNKDILGSGGFGTVYKLNIDDSTAFAVKRLYRGSPDRDKGFERELEAMGDIKHRNIVTLHGYYTCPSYNLLIYELMPNGSLDSVLHGRTKNGINLDWCTRYKIALGAARGITYLHHDCIPHIIHRDIKSSNILLNESMEARVSDFGLATLMGPEKTHVSTVVAGTFGYLAPEYFDTGRATAKGDVYSFGVVLLEILTGKKPMDDVFLDEGTKLVTWVKTVVTGKREDEVVDSRLESYVEEEVNNVFSIAMMCLEEEPSKRPTMTDVVKMLEHVNELGSNLVLEV